jgi:hypothetical protein
MPLGLSVSLAVLGIVVLTAVAGYLIDKSTGDADHKPNH